MNAMLNHKIVPILSLSAFAVVLGAQVARAEIITSSHSAADLIGETTQNKSRAASTTLAQTEVEVQTETEIDEAPTEQTQFDTEPIVPEEEIIGPSAPSYLGIGGSLGLIEDEFGDFGAFAVTSKLRLFSLLDSEEGGTDLSVRPSVIIGEDVTFVVPATIDLRLAPFTPFTNIGADAFVPYLGPGFTVTTGDDSAFKFLLVAGLDVPIGQFTTNAQFNIGFLDETALGLTLSIGYNF